MTGTTGSGPYANSCSKEAGVYTVFCKDHATCCLGFPRWDFYRVHQVQHSRHLGHIIFSFPFFFFGGGNVSSSVPCSMCNSVPYPPYYSLDVSRTPSPPHTHLRARTCARTHTVCDNKNNKKVSPDSAIVSWETNGPQVRMTAPVGYDLSKRLYTPKSSAQLSKRLLFLNLKRKPPR